MDPGEDVVKEAIRECAQKLAALVNIDDTVRLEEHLRGALQEFLDDGG